MADHGGVAHHKRLHRHAELRACLLAYPAALVEIAAEGLPIARALKLRTLNCWSVSRC